MLNQYLKHFFSGSINNPLAKLLVKTPKNVTADLRSGFLATIFQQSKKSPTYLLLKELFAYLHESALLTEQFPFIKSDVRFEQNWMVLHLQILKSRLRQQHAISDAINQLQLQKFNYNAQVYFFPDYAKYLNPLAPLEYTSHYSEAFLKRFQIYDQQFLENYEKNMKQEILKGLLRKLIYENRVALKDIELQKLTQYYIAHRRYLSMLEWTDIVQYRIKWGFESERRLLEELGH